MSTTQAKHTPGPKVHYMRGPTRSWCRYSSRPSRNRLTLLQLADFLLAQPGSQCADCLRAARRDDLLARAAKATGEA